MGINVKVKGLSELSKSLEGYGGACARGFENGLRKGGLYLQSVSQKLVPVDTGNLKNSAFTRAKGKGFNTVVQVGYTANYAIYVHENMSAYHKRGIPKFLEVPFRMPKVKLTILNMVKVSIANQVRKRSK